LGLNCAKNGPGRQAIQAPEKLGLNDWGLNYWAWTSYIRARVNNSRSNVYRGGLCKHAKAARGFPYCILWQLLADRKLLFPCVKAFPKSDDSWTSRWCTIGETAILIQYTDWKRVSHRRSILGESNRWLRGVRATLHGGKRKAMSCINGNTWRYWRSQDNALPYLITVYNI
jgi:hypothetical protein